MYEELIDWDWNRRNTSAEDSDVEAGPGACSKHCWQSGFSTGKLCCGYCTQDDADFIRAYSQPRNYGFNTA